MLVNSMDKVVSFVMENMPRISPVDVTLLLAIGYMAKSPGAAVELSIAELKAVTGLCKTSIITNVSSLESRGLLLVSRGQDARSGNLPNSYRLTI